MNAVNISGLDKVEVLRALYDRAQPLGMGWLHYTPEPMSREDAIACLERSTYFDYLRGRVMKINLSDDIMQTGLYNRDNGENAAEEVIQRLRDSQNG